MPRYVIILLCLFSAPARADFIWGNKDYGFWAATTISRAVIRGKQPLTIFERKAGRCAPSRARLRRAALPADLPVQPGTVEGDFGVPYFLVNGALSTPEAKAFIAILNRRGETVWAHFISKTLLAVKPLVPGQLALLYPEGLEVISLEGKKVWGVTPSLPLAGDFVFPDAQKRTFLTFSPVRETHRPWWNFWGDPEAFDSSRLVEISGDTGTFQERWRPVGRGHAHLTSLAMGEGGGILVSSPGTNRVFFLDTRTAKVQWSMGRDRENTFATAESPALFHAQASVVAPSAQQLLLFDNGLNQSRVLLLRIDTAAQKVAREREWFAPQKLYSRLRGSAYALSEKNVLGYFPNASRDTTLPEYLFEFTRDDTEPVARMRINWGVNAGGQRAIPLTSLGEETFLGFHLPPECGIPSP